MEVQLNIWTCINKVYEKYIPIFALSHLIHNNDCVVEIGVEEPLEEKTKKCIDLINRNFENRLIVRQIVFRKDVSLGAIRFINEPTIKAKYVYITDIDIICLEPIAEQHIKHMQRSGLPYCNKVRTGTRKLTGLHFAKWDSLYPLPDINKFIVECQLRDEPAIKCDEIMLHELMIAKGIKLNYSLCFRPVHGIHVSPHRQPLPTELKPGWEIELEKLPGWLEIKKSPTFIDCYSHFFNAMKKVVSQIDETFDHLQKIKYKGIIYTAIISDYEDLKEPEIVDKNFEYVCFTTNRNILSNREVASTIWNIVYLDLPENTDPVRFAREIKIMYWKYIAKNYKYVIWIDGSIEIHCDMTEFIKENNIDDVDLITISHPHRQCIYEEAERCKLQQKDKDEVIDKHVARYKEEGFPEKQGLISSGILVRNNTRTIKKFMTQWWTEIQNGSRRDQMSFNYVLWKNPIKVKIVDYNITYNEQTADKFILKKHKE